MQNPLIPMVAMTGAPSRQKVFDFVKNMKEKCGFEQLMLYPRSGCEVVYLSEAWFELCSYYIESAASCGMKIWLYDEFNWPAGQAGRACYGARRVSVEESACQNRRQNREF